MKYKGWCSFYGADGFDSCYSLARRPPPGRLFRRPPSAAARLPLLPQRPLVGRVRVWAGRAWLVGWPWLLTPAFRPWHAAAPPIARQGDCGICDSWGARRWRPPALVPLAALVAAAGWLGLDDTYSWGDASEERHLSAGSRQRQGDGRKRKCSQLTVGGAMGSQAQQQ